MAKFLKWVGIFLGVLIGLLIVAFVVVYFVSQSRLNEKLDIKVAAVEVTNDVQAVGRGEYLVEAVLKCSDCHGENLNGAVFIDDPALARVFSANLTTGKNGIGDDYDVADWDRAIRHGVARDGRKLLIMPSFSYSSLSDQDLGATIAYLKSLPAADSAEPATVQLRPVGRIIFLTGGLGPFAADVIDHDKRAGPAPEEGVTEEYGKYLADIGGCTECHRKDLSGGPVPGAPPDAPPASNLAAGAAANWDRDQFASTLRTGTTPEGKRLDAFMPWKAAGNMTDDDISAVWLFIESVQGEKSR